MTKIPDEWQRDALDQYMNNIHENKSLSKAEVRLAEKEDEE